MTYNLQNPCTQHKPALSNAPTHLSTDKLSSSCCAQRR